jgi:hypothetical protein
MQINRRPVSNGDQKCRLCLTFASGMLLDLTFECSGLMIPDQFAKRRLVKRLQHVGESIGVLKSLGKIRTVNAA